ncbi:unnamed protein product [Urochloa decumbens]|uniref:UBX domain-containing protein n=1 Tax=Urochloa decumbens TaxID=240449 RepID=A0ABC9G836_9POAL
MADESLAAFMDVTGCAYDEAFHRLASCGGDLGEAVNGFFNADAGTSSGSRRRSPPPSSKQVIISSSDDSDPDYDGAAAARAPVPARHRRARGWAGTKGGGGARGRSPPSGSSPRMSRWDSETARGYGRGNKKKKRCRRVDMFASSSDEEEEEEKKVEAAKKSRRQRRRLDPKQDSSDEEEEKVQAVTTRSTTRRPNNALIAAAAAGGEKKSEDGSLRRRYPASVLSLGPDEDMDMAEAPPPPPESAAAARDALFRAPGGLAYRCGSLHGAKAEAARRRRWLLVNVQGLDLASVAQNRDVWGSELVACCVRDHFVLWQGDAGDVDGGGVVGEEEMEARKVLGYYKVPLDKIPVVVVVDPVTGEAVDRLHGTDPNDFLVSVGPYTDKKPEFPVLGAAKKSIASAAAALQSIQKLPAAATTAPASRKEEAPAARKPDAAAAAPAIGQELAPGEKVCKMRVRMPDGRVVAQEFGSQRAVAALFAYCRSELGTEKKIRLMYFVGASREAIGDESASFESLGLHMSTVCVQLG